MSPPPQMQTSFIYVSIHSRNTQFIHCKYRSDIGLPITAYDNLICGTSPERDFSGAKSTPLEERSDFLKRESFSRCGAPGRDTGTRLPFWGIVVFHEGFSIRYLRFLCFAMRGRKVYKRETRFPRVESVTQSNRLLKESSILFLR
jgi:hypothetical protein